MLVPSLPIDSHLENILKKSRSHQNMILTASPGVGKTTRVPPMLLSCVSGKIIVLQPRRMAAVAACHRVCEERGWRVGQEAGYQVRFESKVQKDTRLIFMTDALLLRHIQSDPDLSGVDLVIIDEFHERNLSQDLVLGYIREQQELGRGLKLLLMSATLNVEKLRRYLGDAAVMDVPGDVHPLTIEHQTEELTLSTGADFIERVAGAVKAAVKSVSGDVLVFLPGVGEINRVRDKLSLGGAIQVCALHGSLSLAEQQAVLRPSDSRRVILATNVAEASVTVSGVNGVVDSGVAKVMECNLKTGFSQLSLQRISRFNATQRAGRAARQAPGLCIRLWTPYEEVTQAAEPVAEVERVDLSAALLWLAGLKITRFEKFLWLDPPAGRLLDFARRSLAWLGAIDADNCITKFGEKILNYPLPPRWGALLAMGEDRGMGGTAARMAAILSERDGARTRVAAHQGVHCDVWARIEAMNESSRGEMATVVQTARQLSALVRPDQRACALEEVQAVVLLSQGDRLCRRRDSSDRALMVGSRGIRLANDSLAKGSEFFVALHGVDLPGQADTLVTMASGFNKAFVLKHLGDRVETRHDVYFDAEREQFYGRKGRFLFDLPIDSPALTSVAPDEVGERLVDELCARWESVRARNESLNAWLTRWEFLCEVRPEYGKKFTDKQRREVLAAAAFNEIGFGPVLARNFSPLIEMIVGKEISAILDREVPETFHAPSGVTHKIDYSEKHSAFVNIRLQEIFGLQSSPRLAFGKVPITFRLLGPNFRPVQVTSDLENFWREGYAEVRKELRARYPKHSWPENGLTAKPEAKGRRRS